MTGGGIEFDDSEFQMRLRRLIAEVGPKVERALEAAGDIAQREARDRAPVDEGVLTDSIEHEVYVNEGSVVIRVPINAPASEYAVPMHEGQYNLGPKSAAKQSQVGVAVGRKYITRALDENRKEIRAAIAEELKPG